MWLCTEVAAVFTLSVPREAKAMDVSAWAPMSFGVMQGGPLWRYRWGEVSSWCGAASDAPWNGSTVKSFSCCDFDLPWWPRYCVQAPMLQLTLQVLPSRPWDSFWVFRASSLPAGSFIANVGTSAPAWTQSGGWQQGGCTLQQSIQTLHYLSLWQDFSRPPLHFPYLIKLKARHWPPCQGRVPSVPDNGSFWAAQPAFLTGTVRFGVMNATLLAETC